MGILINFKHVAKKLGLVKTALKSTLGEEMPQSEILSLSERDRLHARIDDSKCEEKR